MKYDIVLCECIGNKGLNKAIVAEMADMLNDDEFYPVEFYADHVEASAIGLSLVQSLRSCILTTVS